MKNRLLVEQKHAHAWIEAWIRDQGWVRIDPTAALPDERVLEQAVENSDHSVFIEAFPCR